MEAELQSPYIRSSNDTLFDQGSNYRQSQSQNQRQRPIQESNQEQSQTNGEQYAQYNYTNLVVLAVIIIIIILCYLYNSTEPFTVSGIRTDPASDSYLEHQIDTLTKMQKRNFTR